MIIKEMLNFMRLKLRMYLTSCRKMREEERQSKKYLKKLLRKK